MEFSINPNSTVKCYSRIRLKVSPGRDNREDSICEYRLVSTLQNTIEAIEEFSGNVFSREEEILGFYLIIRFLLPQTIELEVFETEREIDLHVGSSSETANVFTLSVSNEIVERLKKMLK